MDRYGPILIMWLGVLGLAGLAWVGVKLKERGKSARWLWVIITILTVWGVGWVVTHPNNKNGVGYEREWLRR